MSTVNLAVKPAPKGQNNKVGMQSILIDFAANPVSAADVVNIFNVAEGMIVKTIRSMVVVAEGATCTATCGDGDSAAAYDASINLNASAKVMLASTIGTDNYAVGKYYAATDTVDITMGHDTDAAIMLFQMEYMWVEDPTVISTL